MVDNIKIDDGAVTVRVSLDYYSDSSLQEAEQLFEQNFEISERCVDDYWEIELIPPEDAEVDLEEVGLEFFNHLLSNEKKALARHL